MIEDPSGAGARTALAWGRTGSALVLAGLAVGRGIGGRVSAHPLQGAIVAVLGLALLVVSTVTGHRRAAEVQRGAAAPRLAELVPMAALLFATGIAVLAMAIVTLQDEG